MKIRRAKIVIALLLVAVMIYSVIYLYINDYSLKAYILLGFICLLTLAFVSLDWEENTQLKDRVRRLRDKIKNLRRQHDQPKDAP